MLSLAQMDVQQGVYAERWEERRDRALSSMGFVYMCTEGSASNTGNSIACTSLVFPRQSGSPG